MEYGTPCDMDSLHVARPSPNGKTLRLWGEEPSPAALESSFRVYKSAGRAQVAKFGCVFIFVQPQIPAKN